MAFQVLTRWFGANLPNSAPPADGYFQWWLDGLKQAVPNRLQHHAKKQYVLEVNKGQVELYFESRDLRQRLGVFANDDSALINLLQSTYEGKKNQITIRLMDKDVLVRRTTLPSAVESNLRQVLSYEMDRITPFNADQVYFDYRLVERSVEQNRLVVDLAVVQRDWVDPWLDYLATGGLTASAIEGQGLWVEGNLLPPTMRPAQSGEGSAQMSWILLVMVAFLLMAALAGPLVQKGMEVKVLEERANAAQTQSEVAIALRNRLEQRDALIQFVSQKRTQRLPVVDLLREVTMLFPDNTWVQQLDVKGDLLEVRGESVQATALIELLESSPLFKAVGFRSPVVGVPNRGVERFHIRMEIANREVE